MKHRDVVAPAAVLFTVMTAHGLLETARDALFLARLGPEKLASAYLAIAGVAVVAVTIVRRLLDIRDPRRVLVAFLIAATAGTGILASVIAFAESAVFALYVWTGLIATLVVPCFWTVLDRSLNVGGAKRSFAGIAAGGVLGALAGSAIAAGLGWVVEARYLVTVSAVVFGLATVAAMTLSPRPAPEAEVQQSRDHEPARSRRYLALLIFVGIAATMALTIGNITFKTVLSERLPAQQLATVFGGIYTGLNVVALAIQLLVTPRVLSRFGVGGALIVLPVIIVATSSGFVLTGALVATAVLAIGDGGLRHSLHRVASEILFLAIPGETRDGAKPTIDAVTQRGGQAAAALLVLAAGALHSGTRGLAAMTAIVGLVWLIAVIVIRGAYVAQLRDMLRAGEIQRSGRMPDLDAKSVRLLVAALASPQEDKALAALELLARCGGQVPSFVLDHQSDAVVLRALELLGEESRDTRRLASHRNPQIRAAALAMSSRHRKHLYTALRDREPSLRAAAFVALGVDDGVAHLAGGSVAEREALVHAIYHAPHERFRGTLATLLDGGEVARLVLQVFERRPELADLEQLLPLLADRSVRADVRRVFVAGGSRGRDRLILALEDPRLEVRQHVPRTLRNFSDAEAVAALVARLGREPDGTTERKILRALGHMRVRDPDLPVDEAAMQTYVHAVVGDAVRYALLRDELEAAAPATPSVKLLGDLLGERTRWSIEQLFRALGILHPEADLRTVYGAITSTDEARRSVAREVFEHFARADVRDAVLALVDEIDREDRRTRCGAFAPPPSASYESLLATLLAERSTSLRCVAAHHIAESGIAGPLLDATEEAQCQIRP